MLGSETAVSVTPGIAAGHTEAEGESLETRWRKRLETAGNLLCRLCPDEVSTVSVVLPLDGQPDEIERLKALGRRLADERELSFQAKQGSHSITITFSNRV